MGKSRLNVGDLLLNPLNSLSNNNKKQRKQRNSTTLKSGLYKKLPILQYEHGKQDGETQKKTKLKNRQREKVTSSTELDHTDESASRDGV